MARTKSRKKKKIQKDTNSREGIRNPKDCFNDNLTVVAYSMLGHEHDLYEAALTSPKPFVVDFTRKSYSDKEDANVFTCYNWGQVSEAIEHIKEMRNDISTIVVNNLTAAYEILLRRILKNNKMIYPENKDVWLEAVSRLKTFILSFNKFKKNVVFLVNTKEIWVGDEIHNQLFVRPNVSDSVLSSLFSFSDCVLFMQKNQKGDLVVETESADNNWFSATCKSPTVKSKVSLDFSSFLVDLT